MNPGNGETLVTNSPILLPSGITVTTVIDYDVGGGNNFGNLMLMMFHIYDVTPLADLAHILAAGKRLGRGNFTYLMDAMFAIYEVSTQ